MLVRPLEEGDRPRWDDLWHGYLSFYEHTLDPAISELTWRRLLDPLVDVHGLVAERDGRIVGLTHYLFHPSTWSRAGYCYLEDLYVDPGVRGGGIGRALIEAVYQAADARGADQIYWFTQTNNETARKLYDRIGKLRGFVIYER